MKFDTDYLSLVVVKEKDDCEWDIGCVKKKKSGKETILPIQGETVFNTMKESEIYLSDKMKSNYADILWQRQPKCTYKFFISSGNNVLILKIYCCFQAKCEVNEITDDCVFALRYLVLTNTLARTHTHCFWAHSLHSIVRLSLLELYLSISISFFIHPTVR